MALQTINIGTVANDGTGDTIRDAFDKTNDNFLDIISISLIAGEDLVAGDVVYVKSDGKFWKTDASAEATAGPVLIGIVTTGALTGNSAVVQISGNYTTVGLTVGSIYYLSIVGGQMTATAPSAVGEIVRPIGYATSSTNFVIKPDITYIEVGDGSDPVTINKQTGTAYSLILSDAGKLIEMENGAANVLTIPLNSSIAFPVGTTINIEQTGAGSTTIRGDVASGEAVKINGTDEAGGGESDVVSQGQWKGMVAYQRAADEWVVNGGA